MKTKKLLLLLTLALGVSLTQVTTAEAAVYNGWEQANGYWYYYNNGSMKTGWVNDRGTWYYLNSDGTMKTGWLNDSGTWYYLDGSGAMKTGWIKSSGKWYYLNGSGAMKTGWVKDSGSWYHLGSNGAMETGWIEDNGTRYYLNDDGSMATGWAHIWSKWYYFNTDGSLASNITVDGYYIDSDGEWDSSYDGQVKIEAKKQFYYINQTKSIDFTITNNTRKQVEYSIDYTVEKEVDFEWKKVPLKSDSVSKVIHQLNPGERKEFSISLDNIDEKLSASKYKIVMKIGDKYEYGYFNLSNDNIVNLRINNRGIIKEDAKKVQFTITNNSNDELTYGAGYRIEKFVYPGWVEVPLKNDIFTEQAIVLKPHCSNIETIELDNLTEYSKYDEYRIVKVIDGNEYYDVFTTKGMMDVENSGQK